MNDVVKKERLLAIFKYIIVVILFIGALVAIITGQKNIGPQGLMQMLVGLFVLIGLLYSYNRKYK